MNQTTVGQPAAASVRHQHPAAPKRLQATGRKKPRTVRLSEAGDQRITERAAQADVDFSHMVRRMLAYADRHMPAEWVPPSTSSDGGRR